MTANDECGIRFEKRRWLNESCPKAKELFAGLGMRGCLWSRVPSRRKKNAYLLFNRNLDVEYSFISIKTYGRWILSFLFHSKKSLTTRPELFNKNEEEMEASCV